MQAPATPSPRPSRSIARSSPAPATPQAVGSPSAAAAGSSSGASTDLWTDILRSADRQKALARKNVVLLSERHRGRSHLLDKLVGKRKDRPGVALAIGYEVLEADDREEDAAPPVSIFYPPSSHPSLLRLVDVSLPPSPLPNTTVVIVLDWSKPSTMVRELLTWLSWVDQWAERAGAAGDPEELRARLQSHLQHYTEPTVPAAAGGAPTHTGYNNLGTLLPLGRGTLTLNPSGVPIVVVCTRADLMDQVGDEMGMKGGGWEERTDWIQQVLRTICLAYGATLFFTAPTQPQTYSLLREYLFHRLYATPPPLNAAPAAADAAAPLPSRFPFPHRANVLDRDAVMVPSGWDSWGKINVLREGFDPARVSKAWETSTARLAGTANGTVESEEEALEDLWVAMVPDNERPKPANATAVTTTSEGEQAFLQRQLDVLLKDPNRGAHAAFRHAAASATATTAGGAAAGATAGGAQPRDEDGSGRYGGVVGPMGGGGLNLPGVERAMAEMEGGVDDTQDPRVVAKPTSPTGDRGAGVPNAALHNFFQGLLAKKAGSAANTPTKATK